MGSIYTFTSSYLTQQVNFILKDETNLTYQTQDEEKSLEDCEVNIPSTSQRLPTHVVAAGQI